MKLSNKLEIMENEATETWIPLTDAARDYWGIDRDSAYYYCRVKELIDYRFVGGIIYLRKSDVEELAPAVLRKGTKAFRELEFTT